MAVESTETRPPKSPQLGLDFGVRVRQLGLFDPNPEAVGVETGDGAGLCPWDEDLHSTGLDSFEGLSTWERPSGESLEEEEADAERDDAAGGVDDPDGDDSAARDRRQVRRQKAARRRWRHEVETKRLARVSGKLPVRPDSELPFVRADRYQTPPDAWVAEALDWVKPSSRGPTADANMIDALGLLAAPAMQVVRFSSVAGADPQFRVRRASAAFSPKARRVSPGYTKTFLLRALDFLIASGRCTQRIGRRTFDAEGDGGATRRSSCQSRSRRKRRGWATLVTLTEKGAAELVGLIAKPGVEQAEPAERRRERRELSLVEIRDVGSNGERVLVKPKVRERALVKRSESELRRLNASYRDVPVRLRVDLEAPVLQRAFHMKRFDVRRYARLHAWVRKAGVEDNVRLAMLVVATLLDSSSDLWSRIDEPVEHCEDGRYIVFDLTGLSHVRRIFSRGTTKSGGRLYNPAIQSLPRWARRFLEIAGEPVVEPDYSAQHIRLLYAKEAIAPPDDPYTITSIPGVERDHVKRAALIGINAKSEHVAAWALRDKCWSDGCYLPPSASARDVLEAFKVANPGIAHHICADRGIELMRLDSDMALLVHKQLLDAGIPCFSVHDSFIVPRSAGDAARTAMFDAYFEICGAAPKIG